VVGARRWLELALQTLQDSAAVSARPSGGVALGPDPLTTGRRLMQGPCIALARRTLSTRIQVVPGPANLQWCLSKLHRLPGFAWLREQVVSSGLGPTSEPSASSSKEIALFIQRSGRLVSEEGMVVGRHHHPKCPPQRRLLSQRRRLRAGRFAAPVRATPSLKRASCRAGVGHAVDRFAANPSAQCGWLDVGPRGWTAGSVPASTDHWPSRSIKMATICAPLDQLRLGS